MDATNLVAYLPFDTSTTEDLCGNSWTATGSPTISGDGLNFNANGQYLSLDGGITLGGKDFTVRGKFNLSSSSGSYCVIFNFSKATQTNQNLFCLRRNSASAQLQFICMNATSNNINVTLNTEHDFEVAYTQSDTTIRLFIDGQRVFYWAREIPETNFSNVWLGRANYSADGWLLGTVDEFQIYDGVALHTGNFTPPTADYYTNLKIAMKLATGVDATLDLNLDFERKVKNPLTTWRYENAGDNDTSVIGGATLIGALPESKSVTGNAFYQTQRAKCFDIPATSEIWIKYDVYFDGSNRWRAYNGGNNGITGITAQTSGDLSFFANDSNVQQSTGICIANQLQTVLLHMVSGSSDGVIEAWIDGNFIYQYTGDVNHGQDFADIYLQSDGGNTFFSNVIISNAQIDFAEGWHNIHLDVDREVEKTVDISLDFERRVKNIIDFQFTADLELSYHLPVTLNADCERNVIRSLDLNADLEILDVIPIEFTADLERKILTKFKLYPTDTSEYFSGGGSTPIVIPSQATIPPAVDSEASLQSIEVTIAQQQITDQVKATGIIPFEILSAVEGQVLDYVCNMRVEKVTKRGILYSAECCSDLDELLYTPLNYSLPSILAQYTYITGSVKSYETFYVYPTASQHAKRIADAMGLQLVAQFKDFYSTVEFGERKENGATYNDLLRDIFGWSSRIPTELISVYIRNGKLFVIQRGYEANVIDISNVDKTLPTITHELVRMFYQRDKWSKTKSYEMRGARKNHDNDYPDNDYPDDENPDDENPDDENPDDDAEKSWINVGHVTVEDGEGITATEYYYDSDGVLMRTVASFYSKVDIKLNTVTTTTNRYDSDELLDMTTVEARHPNEPAENTKTVTTYGYVTLPDGRKFLSTEMVEEYSADNSGGYKLDDTRVTTKNPTGRGQSASTDNQGKMDTGGSIGDDRVTPLSKYQAREFSDNLLNNSGGDDSDDYETLTVESYIEGLSLIDTSFPIQDISREQFDYRTPWDKVDSGEVVVTIDGKRVINGNDIDNVDTAKGTGRLRELTAAMKWLNRKTCETVTLSVFGLPHVVDFNDRVVLDGNEYFLVSNTLKITPRLWNEQALTLVRWF